MKSIINTAEIIQLSNGNWRASQGKREIFFICNNIVSKENLTDFIKDFSFNKLFNLSELSPSLIGRNTRFMKVGY